MLTFRLFPDYLKWACFTAADEDCLCPDNSPCLERVYFDNPDLEQPVCLSDLTSGRIRVELDDSLVSEIEESTRTTYPSWSVEQIKAHVERLLDELSRTPPIPWIQNNDWPVCDGDFCQYLGEWGQNKFISEASDSDGKPFLWRILADFCRDRRDSVDDIWNEMAVDWTVIYVFQCLACNKLIAIDQSF